LPDGALSEVVADRGYHSVPTLVRLKELGLRSYIAEPKRPRRRWKGKDAEKKATYANRRRRKSERGKTLSKWRSERVERSMAHSYETGGLRRVHLRGRENILKRVLVQIAAFNLGLVMRKKYGHGTPRGLQGRLRRLLEGLRAALSLRSRSIQASPAHALAQLLRSTREKLSNWLPRLRPGNVAFATGC
jgi:transposase